MQAYECLYIAHRRLWCNGRRWGYATHHVDAWIVLCEPFLHSGRVVAVQDNAAIR